jgi:hypothetical protein
LNELRCAETHSRLRGASLGPELLDAARKTGGFRRLGRVRTLSELMPELGPAVYRLIELGPDFVHGSHVS